LALPSSTTLNTEAVANGAAAESRRFVPALVRGLQRGGVAWHAGGDPTVIPTLAGESARRQRIRQGWGSGERARPPLPSSSPPAAPRLLLVAVPLLLRSWPCLFFFAGIEVGHGTERGWRSPGEDGRGLRVKERPGVGEEGGAGSVVSFWIWIGKRSTRELRIGAYWSISFDLGSCAQT
jgi:hypothetical protein